MWRRYWLARRQLEDLKVRSALRLAVAVDGPTRYILGNSESDLVQCHNLVEVWLVVDLIHRGAVAVLNCPITESNANHLAKLESVKSDDNLVIDKGFESPQPSHGLVALSREQSCGAAGILTVGWEAVLFLRLPSCSKAGWIPCC